VIYQQPATAYAATFIGQTNLLRAHIESGMARCGALAWPVNGLPDGASVFSLRPESIRLIKASEDQPAVAGAVQFWGVLRRQVFGGATDLLEIECADGQVLLARIPSRGAIEGSCRFEFNAADAIRLAGDT